MNRHKVKYQRPPCFQVFVISLTSSTPTPLGIEATVMDFPPDSSGPPLDSEKEEGTSDSKLLTAFKKTEHQHKYLVSHLTLSDKLDTPYSDFTSGEYSAVSNGYYGSEVGMSSASWRIEFNCGTHYIQGGGMVPGKPKDQNSYLG